MKKAVVKKAVVKKAVVKIHPYKLDQAYMFVTVTRYYTGVLQWVGEKELVISNAAWVAHTDRYNKALRTGELRSVEPIPGDVIIGRGAIVEVAEWNHALPSAVK